MKKITGKDVIINRFSLSHLVMPASYRHLRSASGKITVWDMTITPD